MNEADAIDLGRAAIWAILVASGPAVAAAMVIGIIIALFQTLTQIQESTLTFVPKILVVLAVITITAPYVGQQIYAFTEEVYSHIETGF
jgi:flagellar biosynthetic protein FliQ